MEILTGFDTKKERQQASLLLARTSLCGIDRAVAGLAADLRRTESWKLPDAFQAAIARCQGLTLVARNIRDFSPEDYEFVEVPYV